MLIIFDSVLFFFTDKLQFYKTSANRTSSVIYYHFKKTKNNKMTLLVFLRFLLILDDNVLSCLFNFSCLTFLDISVLLFQTQDYNKCTTKLSFIVLYFGLYFQKSLYEIEGIFVGLSLLTGSLRKKLCVNFCPCVYILVLGVIHKPRGQNFGYF